MSNSYGFVILDLKNKMTVLVESHKGNLSYPKGKFEKDLDKTFFDCAIRELEEETGITLDLIEIKPEIMISEIKKDNVFTITYYLGILKNTFNQFKYDSEELKSVKWYHFDSINKLDNLKQSRKNIFQEIKKKLNISD